jgi:hypothetical protein
MGVCYEISLQSKLPDGADVLLEASANLRRALSRSEWLNEVH